VIRSSLCGHREDSYTLGSLSKFFYSYFLFFPKPYLLLSRAFSFTESGISEHSTVVVWKRVPLQPSLVYFWDYVRGLGAANKKCSVQTTASGHVTCVLLSDFGP